MLAKRLKKWQKYLDFSAKGFKPSNGRQFLENMGEIVTKKEKWNIVKKVSVYFTGVFTILDEETMLFATLDKNIPGLFSERI